ncbi:DUF4148 domain-containing protein [Aquabacterium sp. A7-Y]|uniref:DUF4148 domain-containing protein n=1 Tax=Aquabacterium sp. A7-Y TaxID=1349605 RepID=UPI00223E170B|nr:DUF4148 domain-containing protein [Aquabacterium sp. A7-Y]MCW7537060.1 DUF4148 domain-containing protein [Aquabacterium sp. A7-Y]
MNKLIAAALLSTSALLSFGAQAQEAVQDPAPNGKSQLTRAEVIAELRRAQANGEYALLNQPVFDPVAYQELVAKNQAATRLAAQPAPAQVR